MDAITPPLQPEHQYHVAASGREVVFYPWLYVRATLRKDGQIDVETYFGKDCGQELLARRASRRGGLKRVVSRRSKPVD